MYWSSNLGTDMRHFCSKPDSSVVSLFSIPFVSGCKRWSVFSNDVASSSRTTSSSCSLSRSRAASSSVYCFTRLVWASLVLVASVSPS